MSISRILGNLPQFTHQKQSSSQPHTAPPYHNPTSPDIEHPHPPDITKCIVVHFHTIPHKTETEAIRHDMASKAYSITIIATSPSDWWEEVSFKTSRIVSCIFLKLFAFSISSSRFCSPYFSLAYNLLLPFRYSICLTRQQELRWLQWFFS
jgi:hypothetical protein